MVPESGRTVFSAGAAIKGRFSETGVFLLDMPLLKLTAAKRGKRFMDSSLLNLDFGPVSVDSLTARPGRIMTVSWKGGRKPEGAGAGSVSSLEMGEMYYFGEGREQSLTEAAKWFKKAAEEGDAEAENCLGDMYYYGRGVRQDYMEAAGLYRKAAVQGNAEAQASLGLMLHKGRGVERDIGAAAEWYRKAAEEGIPSLRTTSAASAAPVTGRSRTMRRRPSGSGRPLSRAMPRRSATSGTCTQAGAAW